MIIELSQRVSAVNPSRYPNRCGNLSECRAIPTTERAKRHLREIGTRGSKHTQKLDAADKCVYNGSWISRDRAKGDRYAFSHSPKYKPQRPVEVVARKRPSHTQHRLGHRVLPMQVHPFDLYIVVVLSDIGSRFSRPRRTERPVLKI